MGGLGRRIPTTWEHVQKYPLRALLADPADALVVPPAVEKSLGLPWWWKQHDQGAEGSCVGFGCSSMMSITNHLQRLKLAGQDITYRYEARWLYQQAQLIDEWGDTPPGEGTSVRAGCDILRTLGHRRVQRGVASEPLPVHGISANRWATNIDEIRAAIYAGLAVSVGVNWYSSMNLPFQKVPKGDYWISIESGSRVIGGHCLTIFRMSDSRQAMKLMNSWNSEWPPSWISYEDLQRLLDEQGEAAVITDQ